MREQRTEAASTRHVLDVEAARAVAKIGANHGHHRDCGWCREVGVDLVAAIEEVDALRSAIRGMVDEGGYVNAGPKYLRIDGSIYDPDSAVSAAVDRALGGPS